MINNKTRPRKFLSSGYVLVYFPQHPNSNKGGYVLEHRLVVEIFIGRLLTPKEKVHHIDLNKHNNKISNLMLFSTNSAHIKFHLKIRQFGITGPVKRQIANRWNDCIS